MALDKIKRQFIWLRKVLGIIDKTTLPGEVLGDVRVMMDLFGWDRFPEAQIAQVSNPLADFANSAPGPDDTTRLILNASARHTDVINHDIWIEKNPAPGVLRVGLNQPTNVIGGTDAGLTRPTFLNPGDFLRARVEAAVGAGTMVITTYFIDLPQGEYIPYL